MSEPKFRKGQHVVVNCNNPKARKFWGRIGIIVDREHILVRKLFRTDYQVVMAVTFETCTFKEGDLDSYRP